MIYKREEKRKLTRQERGKEIKTIISLVATNNDLLRELRDEKDRINTQREDGVISFKAYWNLRMDIECSIQNAIERRDAFSKRMARIFYSGA